ncbi:MAG TPA: hypothetical protein VK517_01785 [Cyclobacteriaceae bacterium]|nr:hypothetical protein [Cyclobacteriaceae bacterium]
MKKKTIANFAALSIFLLTSGITHAQNDWSYSGGQGTRYLTVIT